MFSNMCDYWKTISDVNHMINYRKAILENEGFKTDCINWDHYKKVVNAKFEQLKNSEVN